MKKTDLQIYFDKYIQECQVVMRRRPQTIRGYQAVMQLFFELMPDVDINNLNRDIMINFLSKLQTRERMVGKDTVVVGVKDSTIKTYWNKINTFFKWLVVNKVIEENPLQTIKVAEPQYNDKKELKKKDIEKLTSAITLQYKNSFLVKRDLCIIMMLLFTGIRRGELIALQVRDVDFQKNKITIRGATSKSKKDRTLPMQATLVRHLTDYLDERSKKGYKSAYLFTSINKDSGLSVHGLKHWVKKQRRISGVEFHLHQFRHTFACTLARTGIDVYNLQRLMGHTDLRMTQRYLRSLNVEDLRGDIDKLSIENMI